MSLSAARRRAARVVRLDRRLVEAELKIATGLVEPHFMAGWSGGRKVIAPGVAHAETITTFHNAAFMAHPRAANCVLDGNPLHEEQLAIVGMLGGALALNTVIDDDRRLAFVNFGEIVPSHLEAGRASCADYAEVPVAARFKTVVTSAAGYPLDKTYYQTVKGMVGADRHPGARRRPDHRLAPARRAWARRTIVEAQRRLVELGPERLLDEHRAASRTPTSTSGRPRCSSSRCGSAASSLYTDGLRGEERRLTGVERIGSVEAAIAESIARHGDPRVAFVPEGPYVVPVHAGGLSRRSPTSTSTRWAASPATCSLAALLDAFPELARRRFAAMRAAGLPAALAGRGL